MSDRPYDDLVVDVLTYFSGRPPACCVTCGAAPEARPGVRLCIACLKVAATIHAAIQKQAEPTPVGPCCEGVSRVERVPGDATTLVGWTCPVHGETVASGAKP